ncbi:class I SAM-dependent methyltransferase [Hydrogenobacter thermophilus]|uniref:class I SAM-dependent methyltransferase n=1 Tax=Hydrogenobacter thermophilus TaxID=940 RepID=UPI0030FC8B48
MAFKFPAENWKVLLNPERSSWQSIEVFLSAVNPSEEEVWADLGCGPGYFTIPLASKVKKVYAVDLEERMLEVCASRAKEEGITNMELIKCQEDCIPLPDEVAHRILMANLLHELVKPAEFLAEVRRISRPNAKIVVIDWHPIPSPAGPPVEERIPKEEAKKLMEENGFILVEDLEVYPYHYFLIFGKEELNGPGGVRSP